MSNNPMCYMSVVQKFSAGKFFLHKYCEHCGCHQEEEFHNPEQVQEPPAKCYAVFDKKTTEFISSVFGSYRRNRKRKRRGYYEH